jgi:hydroxymethylglutaryl-CoA synthase
MAGIISFGAYIPYHRIKRAEIAKFWGIAGQQGEKAVAGYDEDSLTMAVAASQDCLKGVNIDQIDGVYFASTTSPYLEKQSAAMIAAVLGLKESACTIDFGGSLRSGTNALKAALDAVNSGSARQVLVCASEMRLGYPAGSYEMSLGDGAAAVLVGKDSVLAEIENFKSYFDEIQDVWRHSKDTFVRQTEERFVNEKGYDRILTKGITDFLKETNLKTQDFVKVALYAPTSRYISKLAKKLKLEPDQILGNLCQSVGDTGSAMSLMFLVSALENSAAGDRILAGSYGNGCDIFNLVVKENPNQVPGRYGIQKYIESKKMLDSYGRYLRWRDLITTQPAARPPIEIRQPSPIAQWRETQKELRLVGTKCLNCGTPQYPPQRVCINCGTKDKYELYSFADKPAKLFSFSHDYVMESIDPPVTITVVDFEGGGRIMCDMTDRDINDVEVGMPLEMTFRKLYEVKGVNNYWWKCQPKRN